jgi:DNA-binding response OmpR family regulator
MDRPPAVALIDCTLSDLDGLETSRILRSRPQTSYVPIILFNSRETPEHGTPEISVGADDYLLRADFSQVARRIRLILQRRSTLAAQAGGAEYVGRHLVVKFAAHLVRVRGKRVNLTPQEFRLLKCLIEHRDRVISQAEIRLHAWGVKSKRRSRTVAVHVTRLRAKLGAAGAQIRTVRDVGYCFTEED